MDFEKLFFPILSLQGSIHSIVAGCLASDETGITDLQCRFLKGNEGSGRLRDLCKAICGVRAGICTPGPSIFPLYIHEHLLLFWKSVF